MRLRMQLRESMALPNVPMHQIVDMAQNGSPALLSAAGRMLGLGQAETSALTKGKIPAWFWITMGVGAGIFAGVRAYRMWPEKFPEWVKGK